MANSVPPRQPAGWIFCAAIFFLIISSQTAATFDAVNPKNPSPVIVSRHLEDYVRAQVAAAETPDMAPVILARAKVTPQQLADALQKTSTKDVPSALLYSEVLTELHRPVPSEVVAKIRTAEMPEVRTLAGVYVQPPPDPATLRSLVKGKPDGSFAIKLGQVQALELAGDKGVRKDAFGSKIQKPGIANVVVIGLIFIVPLLISTGLLFFYNDARNQGRLKPLGHPLEPHDDVETDGLAMRAAVLLSLFIASAFFSLIPWQYVLPRTIATFVEIVLPPMVLAVGALFLIGVPIFGRKLSLASYGITRKSLKADALWGLGGFLGGVPLVGAAGIVFMALTVRFLPTAPNPISDLLNDPQNTLVVIAATLVATISAPIFEEIMFRGTLLPAISGLIRGHKYQVPIAIGVSSLLFAASHSTGVPSWGVLGGIGALTGLLCYQTRSILPGMIVHFLYNGTLVALSLIIQG